MSKLEKVPAGGKTEPVTILANNQPLKLDCGRFTCIVHQQGIKVKVPDSLTINAMDNIKEVDALNQKQWSHISTGPLFKHFFDFAMHGGENRDQKN